MLRFAPVDLPQRLRCAAGVNVGTLAISSADPRLTLFNVADAAARIRDPDPLAIVTASGNCTSDALQLNRQAVPRVIARRGVAAHRRGRDGEQDMPRRDHTAEH